MLQCCVNREGDYIVGVIIMMFDTMVLCIGCIGLVAWVIDLCYYSHRRRAMYMETINYVIPPIQMRETKELALEQNETLKIGIRDSGGIVVVIGPA